MQYFVRFLAYGRQRTVSEPTKGRNGFDMQPVRAFISIWFIEKQQQMDKELLPKVRCCCLAHMVLEKLSISIITRYTKRFMQAYDVDEPFKPTDCIHCSGYITSRSRTRTWRMCHQLLINAKPMLAKDEFLSVNWRKKFIGCLGADGTVLGGWDQFRWAAYKHKFLLSVNSIPLVSRTADQIVEWGEFLWACIPIWLSEQEIQVKFESASWGQFHGAVIGIHFCLACKVFHFVSMTIDQNYGVKLIALDSQIWVSYRIYTHFVLSRFCGLTSFMKLGPVWSFPGCVYSGNVVSLSGSNRCSLPLLFLFAVRALIFVFRIICPHQSLS
jgi:hypothetical protein